MVTVGIFLAVLLVAVLACVVPGVLTVGFIRLHERMWRRFDLRWPWATAELAHTQRRLREGG